MGWGGGGGGGVVVQTDFRVKPTTKLLWVAFGLGCCCLALLWGYDNYFDGKFHKGNLFCKVLKNASNGPKHEI